MDRMELINALIERGRYTRYLEIGCQVDISFNAIRAEVKVGVDPVSGGTVRMRSDDYFRSTDAMFDLIFIDGDHHHDQVARDIDNALMHLEPNGTIVMHDCLPPDPTYETVHFCGTAWRAFLSRTRTRPDLESFCGDFDFGVGIVRRLPNSQIIHLTQSMDQLTYEDLERNRATWMRPMSADSVRAVIASPSWAPAPA